MTEKKRLAVLPEWSLAAGVILEERSAELTSQHSSSLSERLPQ
jgi:hypothetical protein